jgi:hypothetical protein
MTIQTSPLKLRLGAIAVAAIAAALASGTAQAGELPLFLNAPAPSSAPAAKSAVQYELKLHLPQGRGLARLLIDAGVDRDEAASAARLAAGHLGDGAGGCYATISIAGGLNGSGFRLMRMTLLTEASQTVIERRGADLSIASEGATRKSPKLV